MWGKRVLAEFIYEEVGYIRTFTMEQIEITTERVGVKVNEIEYWRVRGMTKKKMEKI